MVIKRIQLLFILLAAASLPLSVSVQDESVFKNYYNYRGDTQYGHIPVDISREVYEAVKGIQ